MAKAPETPETCERCGSNPVSDRMYVHVLGAEGEHTEMAQHLCEECLGQNSPAGMADIETMQKNVERIMKTGNCQYCGARPFAVSGVPPHQFVYCYDCRERGLNDEMNARFGPR